MYILLGILVFALLIIAITVAFVVYKANKFKNKVEDAIVDGVKDAIVENAPKVIDAIEKKLKKNG